jgi:hypothetical protein
MIKQFVVYGVARVGSNYFVNQLNNHSQILCHYELFHPRGPFFGFADKGIDSAAFEKKWDVRRRDQEPFVFLADLLETHQGEEALGYNIFPGHNQAILKGSLLDVHQKKIILRRKDLLKSYISGRLANKTGVWVCENERDLDNMKDAKVHFLRDEFLSYLLRIFNYYNYLETVLGVTRQNFLTVYYEDVMQDRDATFNKIFTFLNVRQETLDKKSKFIKQSPDDLELLVDNYQDMKAFMLKHNFFNFYHFSNIHYDWTYTLKKKIIKSIFGK